MQDQNDDVIGLFRESGALLEGHFILRSGRRSGHFFQCARVCENLAHVARLAGILLGRVRDAGIGFDTVLAPAMGGLVIGQEVARQAGARYLFAEKVDDRLALRRNFRLAAGERVLVVEDVVTRGGRVTEALELVRGAGGKPVAVCVIVDRSDGGTDFGVPFFSAARLEFPTYDPGNLPEALRAIPPEKPGS